MTDADGDWITEPELAPGRVLLREQRCLWLLQHDSFAPMSGEGISARWSLYELPDGWWVRRVAARMPESADELPFEVLEGELADAVARRVLADFDKLGPEELAVEPEVLDGTWHQLAGRHRGEPLELSWDCGSYDKPLARWFRRTVRRFGLA